MLKVLFETLEKRKKEDFFCVLSHALKQNERRFVITANPETLMLAEQHASLAAALTDKEVTVVPDGIGVVRAAESLGYEMHGRIPGVELSAFLFSECARLEKSVFLYGTKQDTLTALCEKLAHDYPTLRLAGAKNGYDFDDDEVMDEAARSGADVVLVALGIPRQEELLYRSLPKFEKGVLIGVGGSFDVLSGKLRRAPALFVRLNLEWLWRILREPRRISRFLRSNLRFLSRVRKVKKQL